MTDIWAEKPVRFSSETMLVFEGRRYSWEYQLKIEYDKLKEKAEKYDSVVEMLNEHNKCLVEEREILVGQVEAIRNLVAKAEAGTGIGDEFFTMSLHYTKLQEIIGTKK